ncbi:MAG: hypothetical protein HY240_02770 [Actinobacteria bacterium]|nr:hypothetical protein [Actinomycetota bacterium]
MRVGAPPVRPEARRPGAAEILRFAWLRGLLALAGAAAIAFAIAAAEWLALGRPFGLRLPVKLGWLYLLSFHRVGIGLTLSRPLAVGGVAAPGSAPGGSVYKLHVAFLLGTALAGWLLWRAGRAAGARAEGSAWRRAASGAAVAPAYAVPLFLGSLAVVLRFPGAFVSSVKPVTWEALAFPGVFALTIGGAGGWSSAGEEGTEGAVSAGFRAGWRMFVAAIVLAFVGFLALAGVEADASGAYVRFVSSGRTGALVAVHHGLLAPNQSVGILAAAMGSCDELGGYGSRSALCFRSAVVTPGWGSLLLPHLEGRGPVDLPPWYVFFLLVPAGATIGGGRSLRGPRRARVGRSVLAGVWFAVLTGIAAWASRVVVTAPAGGGAGVELVFGPQIARTALAALAWGIVGGAVGALLPSRRRENA